MNTFTGKDETMFNRIKRGGVICAVRLMLCRRAEAKKCATTGLSYNGPSCQIDAPLNLYHGLNGIVIAPNVHIGKNVTMFQHVTIAQEDANKTTIIEDNVCIGAGTVILNNAHIGNGVRIGANAVVTVDVPAGATVAGVPAKMISVKE